MDTLSKKFWIYTLILFIILGIITAIEILDFKSFSQIFLSAKDTTSWFIGITFGFVFGNIINLFRKGVTEALHQKPREEFVFFIMNLVVMIFLISTAHKISLLFFNTFFEFFHLIFTQWVVLVFIAFKLVNKYEIPARYVLANEVNIIIYA